MFILVVLIVDCFQSCDSFTYSYSFLFYPASGTQRVVDIGGITSLHGGIGEMPLLTAIVTSAINNCGHKTDVDSQHYCRANTAVLLFCTVKNTCNGRSKTRWSSQLVPFFFLT